MLLLTMNFYAAVIRIFGYATKIFIVDLISILFVIFSITNNIPAGKPRRNDVGLVLMRRHHVASLSVRRHFDVMCPVDKWGI